MIMIVSGTMVEQKTFLTTYFLAFVNLHQWTLGENEKK